ncbi:MAG: hypothetical protein JWL63_2385 [Rhodocyclales bacterium]|nr:hypothetical protein [Rhodocyclales bacterium]
MPQRKMRFTVAELSAIARVIAAASGFIKMLLDHIK